MNLNESLEALAIQNVYGVAFLIAYGATWIACGVIWRRAGSRTAALCTLFQGMIALPAALGLSFAIGALGQQRPVDDEITQLSIYIGTSQLLGLPLLVYLFHSREYTLVPYAFAVVCSMHFMLYSWLYQTPIYVAMAITISIGTTGLMLAGASWDRQTLASRVCLFTGAIMLLAATTLFGIHLLRNV